MQKIAKVGLPGTKPDEVCLGADRVPVPIHRNDRMWRIVPESDQALDAVHIPVAHGVEIYIVTGVQAAVISVDAFEDVKLPCTIGDVREIQELRIGDLELEFEDLRLLKYWARIVAVIVCGQQESVTFAPEQQTESTQFGGRFRGGRDLQVTAAEIMGVGVQDPECNAPPDNPAADAFDAGAFPSSSYFSVFLIQLYL